MSGTCRCAFDIRPKGKKPRLHFFLREHRQRFLNGTDRAITAALAEEKNVFDIVLNHGTGLVRFSIESRTIAF